MPSLQVYQCPISNQDIAALPPNVYSKKAHTGENVIYRQPQTMIYDLYAISKAYKVYKTDTIS